jgi:glycerol-3-phosphate dehydrogenase
LGEDGLSGVHAMTAAPIMSHRGAGREVTAKLRAAMTPQGAASALSYAPRMPLENTNTPRIAPGIGYTLADVRSAVRSEHARTLMGVLYRRSGAGLKHDFTDDQLTRVAGVMAEELGWSSAQSTNEIDRFKQQKARLFGVPSGPGEGPKHANTQTKRED